MESEDKVCLLSERRDNSHIASLDASLRCYEGGLQGVADAHACQNPIANLLAYA